MALHLNLYHETQKAAQLKRRDPLKISIYGLVAMAALFAGYYLLELGRMHAIKSELASVEAEFKALEPDAKKAKEREDEITADLAKSTAMTQRIEGRFYWAPILTQIAQIVPPDVQITRIAGDLSGEAIRTCSLTLDGISAGEDPRKVAEDLRTAITERFSPTFKAVTSKFKSLEDGTEMVLLDGAQKPTATFAINVQLSSGEEAAATPAPRRKR